MPKEYIARGAPIRIGANIMIVFKFALTHPLTDVDVPERKGMIPLDVPERNTVPRGTILENSVTAERELLDWIFHESAWVRSRIQ
jgi:hypothetical protein